MVAARLCVYYLLLWILCVTCSAGRCANVTVSGLQARRNGYRGAPVLVQGTFNFTYSFIVCFLGSCSFNFDASVRLTNAPKSVNNFSVIATNTPNPLASALLPYSSPAFQSSTFGLTLSAPYQFFPKSFFRQNEGYVLNASLLGSIAIVAPIGSQHVLAVGFWNTTNSC